MRQGVARGRAWAQMDWGAHMYHGEEAKEWDGCPCEGRGHDRGTNVDQTMY